MLFTISSKNLQVQILSPPYSRPPNSRFDSACFIESVTLNGKHSFCVPEQRLSDRWSSHGSGLCAEFAWHELACEAKAGQRFPKLGVGLLTQTKDNAPYDIRTGYEVEPFELSSEALPDRVRFIQHPKPCMGISARVYREVVVRKNMLALYTTLENTGERILDLSEYQHNFVAIDDIPVGPGYRLRLPFDGGIAGVASAGKVRASGEAVPGLLTARSGSVFWGMPMTGLTYHKTTEQQDILPMARYFWKLTHDGSPASIQEVVSFSPSRLVLWGAEHCICPEVYVKLHVGSGEKQSWSRIWIFEDETTEPL